MLPIKSSSEWMHEEMTKYLQDERIPIRIACNTDDGFPLICSLWYLFDNDVIWCATHQNSALAGHLEKDGKCAFEIAHNNMPYKGVRGQGVAHLDRVDAAETLDRLIARYLGDGKSDLARWLTSRADKEYALRLDISWVSAWDYSERMATVAA